ncbi:MAG: 3-oxoacyl-(acyl-carrier-protein) reductase [Bacteriovoracaceae bacterium]|nr:3-oxoacyl-(acyl-carrier-protein) reductase [Bacteriovoracaceae bacterium]
MTNAFSLSGQVALITGGSRGIGAAISLRLAEAGATVLVNYKSNREAAEKVVHEARKFSSKSEAVSFDISNVDETEAAIEGLTKKFEAIPILVCNAGISKDSLLPRASAEHFEEILRTNLFGTIHTVRLLSRSMMKNRYGRIICMSSVVGEMGNKGQSAYAASKSALFGFSKSVALELGSRNVTCNVICPGFIETEMTERLDLAVRETYFGRIPIGRFGTAEEVAGCVQFLASKEAAYITGAVLDVNGGLYMR